MNSSLLSPSSALPAGLLLALATACVLPQSTLPVLPPPSASVVAEAETPAYHAEATRILENFRAEGEKIRAEGYRIASGDDLGISVWGHEELSGTHRVGPDGFISLPVVGDVLLGGLTRVDALQAVRDAYGTAYEDLAITVSIESYTAYSIVVLGSVDSPGEYRFATVPTLLRVLGEAKGRKADGNGLLPQRCAIIRGTDAVLWVDLEELLDQGDLSLNVDLIPGDVIHVTADTQRLIYVLGEVSRPGMFPLRSGMTTLDAIALAGGVTEDADDDGIRLLRPTLGSSDTFDYEEFSEGDFLQDRSLAKGDVVFVPRHTLAEIGWVFDQLSPVAQMFFFYKVARN